MRIALATPDEWESCPETLSDIAPTTFTSPQAVGAEEAGSARAPRCRPAIRSLYSAWFPRGGDFAVFYADPVACEGRSEQAESEPNVQPMHGDQPDPAQPALSRGAEDLTCWTPRTRRLSEAEWKQLAARMEVLAVLPPATSTAPRPKPERIKFLIGEGHWIYFRILPTMEVHPCS